MATTPPLLLLQSERIRLRSMHVDDPDLLRYAFHELRFQKYNIRCIETNQPMIRHAERPS